LDPHIARIVNKFFRLVLINELETVIDWDFEGFGQCLVNAIRDGPDVVTGFSFEQ
jgi:hypothetical protein